MNNYIDANKKAWEEGYEKHLTGWGNHLLDELNKPGYPFLEEAVVTEMNKFNLEGKNIAHFCCNNGRELLSLMRFGPVKGTGFDIAGNFINQANELATMLKINCTFLERNVLDIEDSFNNTFDFLFVSIGALCWFKDLRLFFKKVSLVLRHGGVLFINECHPFTQCLASPGEPEFDGNCPGKIIYDYFRLEPWVETDGIDYVGGTTYESSPFYSYSHTFESIFNAITSNCIHITGLREFDRDISNMFGHLDHKGIPLSYILTGTKF